jgi:hypothetical protein
VHQQAHTDFNTPEAPNKRDGVVACGIASDGRQRGGGRWLPTDTRNRALDHRGKPEGVDVRPPGIRAAIGDDDSSSIEVTSPRGSRHSLNPGLSRYSQAQSRTGQDTRRVEDWKFGIGLADEQWNLGAGECDGIAALVSEIADDLLEVGERAWQKSGAQQLVMFQSLAPE